MSDSDPTRYIAVLSVENDRKISQLLFPKREEAVDIGPFGPEPYWRLFPIGGPFIGNGVKVVVGGSCKAIVVSPNPHCRGFIAYHASSSREWQRRVELDQISLSTLAWDLESTMLQALLDLERAHEIKFGKKQRLGWLAKGAEVSKILHQNAYIRVPGHPPKYRLVPKGALSICEEAGLLEDAKTGQLGY